MYMGSENKIGVKKSPRICHIKHIKMLRESLWLPGITSVFSQYCSSLQGLLVLHGVQVVAKDQGGGGGLFMQKGCLVQLPCCIVCMHQHN